MKGIKLYSVVNLLTLMLIVSCSKGPSNMDESGTEISKMAGIWSRNDGQLSTYLMIEGLVATTCSNNITTVGKFDPSGPSANFFVGGVNYVFPLSFQGDKLIVKVPAQGNVNHVPTEYIRTTNWPCSGGGVIGGGGSSSPPVTGKFKVKIYEAAGACSGANIKRTLTFYTFCENGKDSNGVWAGIWTNGEDSGGKFSVCLFGDVSEKSAICGVEGNKTYTLYNRFYKLVWKVAPDKSSYPGTCTQNGVATIDFQGQTKEVVIKFN